MQKSRGHYRVTWEDAKDAHDEALKYGGRAGIISEDQIKSSLGRPYDGYHRRIWEKAGALAHGLSSSHGFTDGNKRTAFALTNLLLTRSGYGLKTADRSRRERELEKLLVSAAMGRSYATEMGAWFQQNIERASPGVTASASLLTTTRKRSD